MGYIMSNKTMQGIFWPPRGWRSLEFVKNLKAQAIAKDPMAATITGLHYKIEVIPGYLSNGDKTYRYHFSINGWQYSIQNESHEYSILSFDFCERLDLRASKDNFISNIKVKSRPILLTERNAARALTAAIFFIKQISSQKVPDYNRVLRLYKIHPNQRNLYTSPSNERRKSVKKRSDSKANKKQESRF